jgi:serine/threonine protein kinase
MTDPCDLLREDRFVALKILTCEATKVMEPGPSQRADERGLLEKIASGPPGHAGFKHNMLYYDSFDFQGPHGRHLCMVTEVLGYSLDYVRKLYNSNRVPPSIVKRVTRQVLLGLDYLHTTCGIVHAGEHVERLVGLILTVCRPQTRQRPFPPQRLARGDQGHPRGDTLDHI